MTRAALLALALLAGCTLSAQPGLTPLRVECKHEGAYNSRSGMTCERGDWLRPRVDLALVAVAAEMLRAGEVDEGGYLAMADGVRDAEPIACALPDIAACGATALASGCGGLYGLWVSLAARGQPWTCEQFGGLLVHEAHELLRQHADLPMAHDPGAFEIQRRATDTYVAAFCR